jgi:single-strand DNA-binding protein
MAGYKMPEINTVIIAGNLTKDPVLRHTTNGTPVANFFIASNRRYKDNTGQWREDVCYVGVVAWYKLAESCAEYLRKGSAVLIDGELQSRNLRSADGVFRNVVEIKARRIQFLDRRTSEMKTLENEEEKEDLEEQMEYQRPEDENVIDDSAEDDKDEMGYRELKL